MRSCATRATISVWPYHYNFAALFKQIRPYIKSVNVPLCHVETPMTPAPLTGYPIFNTPPALAQAIRQTGWKACSTAATHSLDQGQTGVVDTIRALDQNGILHAGTYASAAAQRTPLIMTVKGIKVAFLSYTELTNGIPSPRPWSVNRAEKIPQVGYPLPSPSVCSLTGWLRSILVRVSTTRATGMSCWIGSPTTGRVCATSSDCGGATGLRAASAARPAAAGGRWPTDCAAARCVGPRHR